MKTTRCVLVLTLLLASHGVATAQTPPAPPPQSDTFQTRVSAEVKKIAAARKGAPQAQAMDIQGIVDVKNRPVTFLMFAYAQGLTRELRFLEDARTDKQVGAPATATGGSTSLVSKGAVPGVLAFAVEHGALTQTVNDTSATLRGNLVGWLDLLRDQNFIASYDEDSRLVRQLRRVSYSFTFDAAPTAPAPTAERPTTEEIKKAVDDSARQLTAYSVRFSIIDQRDPRRVDNRASTQAFLEGPTAQNLLFGPRFLDAFWKTPAYTRWLDDTRVVFSSSARMSEGDIERVLYARLEALRQLMIAAVPNFDTEVARFMRAFEAFEAARTDYFKKLQQRFIMAAEMVRTRPPSKAATSTFRVIAEGRPGTSEWDITGNFAVTYQDGGTALVPDPKETAGWRDVQLAFQAEHPLGTASKLAVPGGGIGRPVFAFEYLSRRLTDKAVVTFAGHDFNVDPGWIHAAQAKITIPVKGSGIKVPFSVSVANRSELLREKTVRAHIGFTVDMDVLVAAVRQ